jgi:hypothetical protein
MTERKASPSQLPEFLLLSIPLRMDIAPQYWCAFNFEFLLEIIWIDNTQIIS